MKITKIMIISVVLVVFADASQEEIPPVLSYAVQTFVTDNAGIIVSIARKKKLNTQSGLAAIFSTLYNVKTKKHLELNLEKNEFTLPYANICWKKICKNAKTLMDEVIQKRIIRAKDINWTTDTAARKAEKDLNRAIDSTLRNLLKAHYPDFKLSVKDTDPGQYDEYTLQLNSTIDPERCIPLVTGELIARGFLNEYLKKKIRESLLPSEN